jgi:hypothetical protein
MPLTVPPLNANGSLRYYTASELQQIDLKRRGVSGEGDHTHESLGPDGAGTPRLYSCAWAERYAAALVLVGYAKRYEDTLMRERISRLLPDTYSVAGDQLWVCTKVRLDPFKYLGVIDPIQEGQDAPRFDRCDIEATYEQIPYDLFDDALLNFDEEIDRCVIKPGFPGAEVSTETNYIGLPGGTLKYLKAVNTPPAGTAVPYPYGFPEHYTNLTYVWRRVPKSLWGAGTDLMTRVKGVPGTRGMIGSLNLTTFDGRPPLTLQLRGVEERLLPDPLGIGYAWDLAYKMSEKPVPFGHLGYYFHSTKAAFGPSGYYEVGRSDLATNLEIAAANLADTDSLFHVREFNELFIPEI